MQRRSILRTLLVSTRAVRSIVKDAGRARSIAATLAKYGFATVLDRRRARGTGADGVDLATRVVSLLEDLGPTFVKFGQILSTRPDLIPPHLAARLQSLQDHVNEVPIEDIRNQVVTGLGLPPENLFASFDPVPIASASIAQVHAAVTKDGAEVVVKVQRPNLKEPIESDLSLLRFFVARVLDVYPEAATFDLEGMVNEFDKSLRRELDFAVEQQSLTRFSQNFEDKPHIHIPRVYAELSCDCVLTMERISGRKLTELHDEDDPSRVAELYLDAAYQMLFQDGFFHGDLHPGNVFLEDDGRLGLIDFGMVGRLSREMRMKVVDVIFSVLREDLEAVARIWYSLGTPIGPVNYAAFESDVVEILETYAVGRPMDQIDIGGFLRSLAEGAVRHRLRLPPDFTMMFKAMITTEGLAKQVAKGVNPLEAARPYIETVIKERYSLERLKDQALGELIGLADIGRGFPGRVDRLVTRLERGELRAHIALEQLEAPVRRLVRATNRGSVALVVSAASITGALTLDKAQPTLLGLPAISLAGFLVAAAGTTWIAFGVLRGR